MNYFVIGYFAAGLIFAWFYDTWLIALGVGGLSLISYYSVKSALPDSDLYQYVLSAVYGIFTAQYIYQMHGLFEMHFIAFISSALLITYQNLKLQIPILIVVVVHHAVFGYIQNSGVNEVYFTQLGYFDLQTFIIHILLAAIIFFICGLWAYQLNRYTKKQHDQAFEMEKLQKESLLSMSKNLHMTNEGLNEARKTAIEKKLHADELEISYKKLSKTNQELDKFVYSLSHDLRAPLTSMLGLIEITEEETEDRLVQTNLSMLKRSVNKLDCLIHDILNYSRNSRIEITDEEIDFREMLNDALSSLQYLNATHRNVEIHVDVENNTSFYCDKLRLALVLKSLIMNAIQYQDLKAAQPFINIRVKNTEKQTLITVSDNGIGIKKELQEKIFEMFYRVCLYSEGSGLGLYIVSEALAKLNGRIEIDSELGRGTTFNIYIPNGAVSLASHTSKS